SVSGLSFSAAPAGSRGKASRAWRPRPSQGDSCLSPFGTRDTRISSPDFSQHRIGRGGGGTGIVPGGGRRGEALGPRDQRRPGRGAGGGRVLARAICTGA